MVPTKIHQQNTPLFYEIDPELLRRVGPVPAVVYAVLLSHDDGGGGGACIAYRVVAQEAGVGLNTAIRAIEKLIDDGLVKSEQQIQNNRQIANIYRYPTFSMPTQDGQVGLGIWLGGMYIWLGGMYILTKFGYTTASLLIAKLHASSRQNSLARALQEYGRLVRTIYLCRYVADEELRRRVRRQLNKGESLHALRRDLFFAQQGHVRRRHLDDHVDQALCLTLVTNATVLWTTTYLGDALDALRADGYHVTDEAAAHLTPAQHDHINFYGTYSFDVETELHREGRRPLRSLAA